MKSINFRQIVILLFAIFISEYGLSQCVQGDCYNGTGTMVFDSGNKYNGEFKNGKREGRGTFVWTSGAKYQGQWLNDKMHGTGTYIFPDRRYYKGEFKNGMKDGSGTLAFEDGKVIQKGMWKEDAFIESSQRRSYVSAGMSIFESVLPDQDFWSEGESIYLPPVGISFDYGVTNNINLGIYVGYTNHRLTSLATRLYAIDESFQTASTEIDYSFLLTAARVTYNLHIFEKANVVPYLGGIVGYSFVTENINRSGTEESDAAISSMIRSEAGYSNSLESDVIYNLFGGIRVYPLKNLGLFAEGGLGFSNLSAGVTYRF